MGSRGVAYSIQLSDESSPLATQRPLFGHVRLRQRDDERLPLADTSLDLVLWAFAFRSLEHVSRLLAETRRVLRPGGRFGVADWVRSDASIGPFRDDRSSSAMCERCLIAGGFSILGNRMLNASHYLIIGRRKANDDVAIFNQRLLTV
jgi:SAM-dependent methyltransferase